MVITNDMNKWSSLTPEEQVISLQHQNNQWSAQQAQKQMDFQREMSNTAHQREVEDLKAAGLNPVLSAKLGGASTPSGAMGTTDTSATSALVDLLALSMQTANSAAGAAYNSSSNGLPGFKINFGGKDFTIDPQDYKFKSPRTWQQFLWNFGMDAASQVAGNYTTADLSEIGTGLFRRAKEIFYNKPGEDRTVNGIRINIPRAKQIAEDAVRTYTGQKTLKEPPSFYEEGKGQSAKSKNYKPNPNRGWYSVYDGEGKGKGKGKKSKKTSGKIVQFNSGRSAAAITGLTGGIGMLGSGLGNFRYGSNPQLQF